MVRLLKTYECLTYYQMAVAVRCFIYPEFIRCGALWLAPGMPPKLSLRDKDDNRIVMIEIPEQFRGLNEKTAMADGCPAVFNASPRMAQLPITRIF